MTLKNVASLSCIALVNAACSAPPVIPSSPQRSATPYPIEVAVPRIRNQPAPRPRPPAYRPQVQTYSGNGAAQVEDLDDRTPMTAIRRPSPAENSRMDEESNRLDPYAPKTQASRNTASAKNSRANGSESESSSAVMALMLRAKLDMLAGRSEVAIEKLERGLRIQPSNPDLWNKLAEAHFHGKNYKQAIAMAKKSMTLTDSSNRRLLKSNWHVVEKANQKMGNMDAMKSAMRMESSLS